MSLEPGEVERIRERFEAWLTELERPEDVPEELLAEEELADVDVPDLYSLTAAVAALTQEVRLSSRAFSKLEEAVREAREERDQRTLEERRLRGALHGLSHESQEATRREARRASWQFVFDLQDRLERHAQALDAARPRGPFRKRDRARHAALVEGLALIRRGALDELARSGVQPFGELGDPFDARTMQALRREPVTDEARDGRVLEVLRRGWRQGDEILRLAEVVVGRCENE